MPTNLIISDPTIMMGKPVIAGSRITVELILEKLAAGESIDQILESHPRLTREGVQAAVISKHTQELAQAFTVITPMGVRIRPSEKKEKEDS